MVGIVIGLRSPSAQTLEEALGNLAHCLIAPGAVISQVPQVRQTTLQFVQQFRMALREEPYGAEKKVLNTMSAVS